jgi:MFS transporter, DHA2 family, multidrug resistance protein
MIRGFGFGFIFVPVAGLTLSGLKGNAIAQASGLSNMLRLLGGAIGIAVINTFVTRRIAVHRNDLMSNISLYNPEANERYYGLIRGFQGQGKSLTEAQQMASGAMEGAVSYQSAVMSYSEGFLVIGIICAVCLPLVFLARIKKGEVVDVSSAH